MSSELCKWIEELFNRGLSDAQVQHCLEGTESLFRLGFNVSDLDLIAVLRELLQAQKVQG